MPFGIAHMLPSVSCQMYLSVDPDELGHSHILYRFNAFTNVASWQQINQMKKLSFLCTVQLCQWIFLCKMCRIK